MGDVDANICDLAVFVYGTLKPGGRYHQRYCDRYLTKAHLAVVKGRLYDFPQWGYPAITPGHEWVKGCLLIFRQSPARCDDILRQLDKLEGYVSDAIAKDNDYQRCWKQIFTPDYQPLQKAWVYQMSRDQVRQHSGVYLPEGDWPVDRYQ
ncbi:MAG: gamma-glutamylcyclotransferase family protein [Phormidesmis sp.]